MMSSGHIVYNIAGKDKEGKFEGQRRYNEFFLLHQTIGARWPGVFIAKIPPKKSFVSLLGSNYVRITQTKSLSTRDASI
jgi:hypothetical protein